MSEVILREPELVLPAVTYGWLEPQPVIKPSEIWREPTDSSFEDFVAPWWNSLPSNERRHLANKPEDERSELELSLLRKFHTETQNINALSLLNAYERLVPYQAFLGSKDQHIDDYILAETRTPLGPVTRDRILKGIGSLIRIYLDQPRIELPVLDPSIVQRDPGHKKIQAVGHLIISHQLTPESASKIDLLKFVWQAPEVATEAFAV